MIDIRKIIIIFVIAVLFSIFVFSFIEAVYPSPLWEEYCADSSAILARLPYPPLNCTEIVVPAVEQDACNEMKGYIEFTDYDSKGCPHNYNCNTCQRDFDLARKNHDRIVFYISALLSLIAVFIGMYLPAGKNELNEWIGTGFMLGGVFALFFGTASTFSSLDRFLRPIVIFIELCLVLFIAYRKIKNLRHDTNTFQRKKGDGGYK